MNSHKFSENTRELRHPKSYYLKWILRQYQDKHLIIIFLLILTILTTAVSVLFPIIFKNIIDYLIINLTSYQNKKTELSVFISERNRLLLILLALGIGNWFTGLYPYLRGKTNLLFEMFFREKYFKDILNKDYNFFLKFRTGDLVTRLTEDVRSSPPGLSWLCCSGIFRAFNSSCIILFCLFSMVILNAKLTALSILPLPLMVFLFWKLETTIENRFKQLQKGISETNDFLESAYSGIKILKTFNACKQQVMSFKKLMENRINLEMNVAKIEGLFMVYFEFLTHIGQLLVLIFGGLMVIKGQLSIGEYYAFFSYLGMIMYPLVDIPIMMVSLAQSFVAIDRLEEINEFETNTKKQTTCETEKIDTFESLEFQNVSFSYIEPLPNNEKNNKKFPFGLKDISFHIKKGEKIAIVGKIGSGKTTLLNCIAGIIKPDSGNILINGIPYQKVDLQTWREKIGFIQQEPIIFSETILNNIDFWRKCPAHLIETCAQISQLDEEIRSFPNAYQERVGQRGITLSGGQRQRLSIARALVGIPQLLLMDDITASLDAENEQKLWEDLHKFANNLTCIIVTHRLASIRYADKIIVMENGTIEAIDTHDNLIKISPIYQELVNH